MRLTYNPDVFRVRDERQARQVILTNEGALTTDERWARETPYLGDILGARLGIERGQTIVDYGCGIGRMARELIERLGCLVVGVDISAEMRGLAPAYVGSETFSAVSVPVFRSMVEGGFRADAAISVWVLQHCLAPDNEIALIHDGLRAGGRFGVVNTSHRAVPTRERGWASDGLDVRASLQQRFEELEAGELDPAVVTDVVARNTYWALYRRA